MNIKLIAIALVVAAPLTVACGAPNEDLETESTELEVEQGGLDAELGSDEKALRRETEVLEADAKVMREIELPTGDELELPDGVTARVRRTGRGSAEIEINGVLDPTGENGGYSASGWGGLIDFLVGKLADKLTRAPTQKCTVETTTVTKPDGTITTTVKTVCGPA
jgi:hypothetical protein